MRVKFTTASGAFRPFVTVLLNVVVVGLLAGFTITYVARQERRICGIIVLLDDRNQKLPPATDKDTTDFRRELHSYRLRLGC